MDDSDDGISPATAGVLLTVCALVGIAFMVGLWFMNRSPDPLYERDMRYPQYVPKNGGNSPEMQTGTGLWKEKRGELPPEAQKPPAQTPPVQPAPQISKPATPPPPDSSIPTPTPSTQPTP
jgi:hypothetical protein